MAQKKKSTGNFCLTITHNDNPIVARYFNTEGFNTNVKRSVDLNDFMRDIVGYITEAFKTKDVEYIYDKYNLREDEFSKKWRKEIKTAKEYIENEVYDIDGVRTKRRF